MGWLVPAQGLKGVKQDLERVWVGQWWQVAQAWRCPMKSQRKTERSSQPGPQP